MHDPPEPFLPQFGQGKLALSNDRTLQVLAVKLLVLARAALEVAEFLDRLSQACDVFDIFVTECLQLDFLGRGLLVVQQSVAGDLRFLVGLV